MSPKRLPKNLEAHDIAVMALGAEAYDLALDDDYGLGVDDHDVLLDQLDAGVGHATLALWSLHPEWRTLDDSKVATKARALLRRLEPDLRESLSGHDRLVQLIRDAIDRAERGSAAARWHGPRPMFREVAYDLACSQEHFENALYLLDPDTFGAEIDTSDAKAKVRLASKIELIELSLEENREIVRQRRAAYRS